MEEIILPRFWRACFGGKEEPRITFLKADFKMKNNMRD